GAAQAPRPRHRLAARRRAPRPPRRRRLRPPRGRIERRGGPAPPRPVLLRPGAGRARLRGPGTDGLWLLLRGGIERLGGAGFVQARVGRWAQHNLGLRQTPVLFGDEDFPLVALRHGRPVPHLEAAPPADYPAWLRDAWKVREQTWAEGAYRTAPRAFRRLE